MYGYLESIMLDSIMLFIIYWSGIIIITKLRDIAQQYTILAASVILLEHYLLGMKVVKY